MVPHIRLVPLTPDVVADVADAAAFERREVEIAYGTLPSFQRRGYASAMAAALVAAARESGVVRTVVAHTLPERNASVRLLERAGFVRDGTAEDPDEGTVWRWALPLGDAAAHTR